jgi:1-acyl-sn-glycerol-3-phosphate acyltransferase
MIKRRFITICFVLLGAVLLTITLPFLAIFAITLDVLKPARWAYIRALLFLEGFIIMEFLGISISFLIWIAELGHFNSDRFVSRNYRLQNWWGVTIGNWGIKVYGLKLEIEKPFEPPNGPFILFTRHASFVDTFLPIMLISSKYSTRMRYVLKQELLWDPCLDIVGNRIPNAFVRRDSLNPDAQIATVENVAKNIGDGEGIVMFPEGTRFTQEKQARVLEIAKNESEAALENASRFSSVLPPQLGGTLGLLESAPDADAVFCAHTGLESTVSFRQLFSGSLVGSVIRIQFHTVRNADIPKDADDRKSWFIGEWLNVDTIVTAWKSG